MANEITSLAELTSGNLADGDLIEIVDVSDTSMAVTGTNKRTLWSSIKAQLKTYFDTLYKPIGSGWTLLSTTTLASNATVTLAIDGYRRYRIEFEEVLGSLDGYPLQMQVSNDAGSTWNTGASDYDWAASKIGAYTDTGAVAAFIRLTALTGNGSGEGVSGNIDIFGANDAGLQFRVSGRLIEPVYNSTGISGWDIIGRRNANSDIDAVKLYFSSGNLLSGKLRVFGWTD